ncbi:carboxypeptidase regulatory-like domain-containing protein [Streptomyces sp. NPDC087300]|uniref:carboxypeptidase regulatory-like domain-containing protein n=1 Tax=Streptomyces sp. NPDC087300 TaxID=3365780 RepID=UPI00381D983B
MSSGDTVVLLACTSNWDPSTYRVRVEHGTRTSQPSDPHDGTPLSYYVMGGLDTWVWASTPFTPGFPAYKGDDPMEWEFTVLTAAGGRVPAGGEISLRIGQTRSDEGPYYFAVPDGQDGATLTGAGIVPFGDDTAFEAQFVEIRAGLGVRPRDITCQRCAAVVGTVTGGSGREPVEGARLISSGSALSPYHPMTATAGSDGTYRLSDPHRHSCVPEGQLTVVATADRHQDTAVTVNVPERGSVTADVFMPCTNVRGVVLEQVGSSRLPLPGVEVELVYPNSADPLDIAVTDPVNGTFTFECVRHTDVRLSTDGATPATVTVPAAGVQGVTLLVSRACARVEGTVRDQGGNPIEGATVTVITTPSGIYQVRTQLDGTYAIPRVCLTGLQPMKAGKPGYISSGANPTPSLPASGTVVVNFVLRSSQPTPSPTHLVDCTLAWGAAAPAPRDLDSHMSGPDPAAAGARWHCFFPPPTRSPVSFVKLDTDDTDYSGPEHIVVSPLAVAGSPDRMVPGDYHYWVRNFSAEQPFTTSDARVTFLVDGATLAQFYASQALGDPAEGVWRVFDFTVAADGSVSLARLRFAGQTAAHGYFMPDRGDATPL